jgi:hypothetical protein
MNSPDKHGKPWSAAEEAELQGLLSILSKDEIAVCLGRTPAAIANKLSELTRRSKGCVSPYAVTRDAQDRSEGAPLEPVVATWSWGS